MFCNSAVLRRADSGAIAAGFAGGDRRGESKDESGGFRSTYRWVVSRTVWRDTAQTTILSLTCRSTSDILSDLVLVHLLPDAKIITPHIPALTL